MTGARAMPPDPRRVDPPDPDADPAAWAGWINDLALAEAEATALVLLAANGFPTDLTRAPTAAEVASRTSYAALEADVDSTTTQVVAAVLAARAALLAATDAVLAGATTIAEVLRRLDFTVAGILGLPGGYDVVTDLQRTIRRLLGALALRAARRLVTDAGRARITPTDPRPLEELLDLERLDSPVGSVLDVQATRVAADTASRTVREVRDVAHRVAAASATTATPTGSGADGPPVAAAFVRAVLADARDTPPARSVTDSAHQGALAATGAARAVAAAAYRRPSETADTDRSGARRDTGAPTTGGGGARGGRDEDPLNTPADGTPRRVDPDDPNRDAARPAAGTPGGAGLNPDGTPWEPEPGAYFLSSELLDRNTCSPCAAVDGTRYATYAAALLDYPLGQYRLCDGGTRCRGTLIMVSAREEPATLDTPFGR